MSINIAGYEFEGPFRSVSQLKEQSGVYVILGNNGGTKWKTVDVGEAKQVKNRVKTHDRTQCWNNQKYDNLRVAARYTNENSRKKIAKEIRQKRNPPCGER